MRGFSQQGLADRAKVGKKTVTRAELGTTAPNFATTSRLAKALDVRPEDLWQVQDMVVPLTVPVELPTLGFKRNTISYTVEQQLAIDHPPANLLIISGAGAGKTQILAQKIITLITDYGLKPRELSVITYTNRAADENRERIRKLYRGDFGHERNLDDIFIGTIHAWCLELIHRHLPRYLQFELLDGMQQFLFIQRHYSKIFPEGGLIYRTAKMNDIVATKGVTLRHAAKLFNVLRESRLDKSKITFGNAETCLKRYEALMHEHCKFDFSALLCLVADSLMKDTAFRRAVVNQLKCVIVDEYQDTNHAQERVLQRLRLASDEQIKLVVVGDDDQLIYGWNNALRENMLEFESRYPAVKRITLNANFRSSEAIIDCSYRVVNPNIYRLEKNVQASSHHKFEPGDILTLRFEDSKTEAKWIVDKITRMLGTPYIDRQGLPQRGLSYSDFAILVRTKRQADEIIAALEQAAVPFQFKGGPGLIGSSSIGVACAGIFHYLHGEYDKEPYTQADLISDWAKTPFKLSPEVIVRAAKDLDAFKSNWPLGQEHSKRSIQKCFQRFLLNLSLSEDQVEFDGNPYCSPGEHAFSILGQFSQLIARFEAIHFGYYPDVLYTNFANFLFYSADNLFDETLFHQKQEQDAVHVMTIHAAKGLEFPAVFVPGMVNNKFPLKPSGGFNIFHFIDEAVFPYPQAYRTPRDEERRLAFVAVSRAEKYLFVSWAPIPMRSNIYQKPSVFFGELASSDYAQGRDSNAVTNKLPQKPKKVFGVREVDFSHLKIYNACPYAYKLRCEYGFQPGYTERLGFGNILHHAFQEYVGDILAGKDLEQNTESYVAELIDRHFHLPYTTGYDKKLRSDMQASLTARFMHLHQREYKNIKGATHIEKEISLLLSDDIRLVGRMDLLRYGVAGKEVLDLKSDREAQSNDELRLQLQGYSLGEWEHSGEIPVRIAAIFADKPTRDSSGEVQTKEPFREPVTEADLCKAREQLRTIAEGLLSPDKPQRPRSVEGSTSDKGCQGRCAKCDVNFVCARGRLETGLVSQIGH